MENEKKSELSKNISRRSALKTAGALLGGGIASIALPSGKSSRQLTDSASAASGKGPIKIGFQVHRTGIGAVYGRWYERTTTAAVKLINEMGGIAGRPVQIIAEDDGTDPKRGAEVVEKLAVHHKVDFVYGTLFSHVVMASAPRAGELKIPYFVVSEG
ncbi:MAG: ABC transporter substrate-binding protein, partial [Desulfobacterales bacterium]